METQTVWPRPKLRRVTQACDFCHRRGLKCVPPRAPASLNDNGAGPAAACQTCTEYGQVCTRLRRPKKRGTKSRAKSLETAHLGGPSSASNEAGGVPISAFPGSAFPGSAAHRTLRHMSRDNMTALINIYLDSIYPLFPFFCETELLQWWASRPAQRDDPYYVSVVCMCALSASQANKGALFTDPSAAPSTLLAGAFLQEAVRLTPLTYGSEDGNEDGDEKKQARDVSLLCCYGILSLIGTQTGDAELLHRYLSSLTMRSRISSRGVARWMAPSWAAATLMMRAMMKGCVA